MNKKISVANLVMFAGGAVTLLFSFFHFWDFGDLGGASAWDTDYGAFVTTIPAILALAMVLWSLAELAGFGLPAKVLTLDHPQLKATWGITSAGLMLAYLTSEGDKGLGFFFMLIGSLAMGIGAVMALLGKGADVVELGVAKQHAAAPTADSTGGIVVASPTPPPPPPAAAGAVPPPPGSPDAPLTTAPLPPTATPPQVTWTPVFEPLAPSTPPPPPPPSGGTPPPPPPPA